MAVGADHGRSLRLDNLLQPAAYQLRDQLTGGAAIY